MNEEERRFSHEKPAPLHEKATRPVGIKFAVYLAMTSRNGGHLRSASHPSSK